jgi:DNA-binding response OmpR family regulator
VTLEMQRTKTRPVILVVEDYADSRQMLKLLLEDMAYSVLTAGCGNDALTIARNNHIDLVLTDFSLPDMTGATVVRRFRQLNDNWNYVPAVMLTAFDGYEYRNLAAEAGCDAFMIKPPNFDTLKETIDRLLRYSHTQPQTLQPDIRSQDISLDGNTNVNVEPLPTSL